MSTRAPALAEQFEQVNAEAITAVESYDDAAWLGPSANEGWTAAFTAWHIGDSHQSLMGLISLAANGQPLPPITAEMLDAANAANLVRHRRCSKADALHELRQNGMAAAEAIRTLSDEQLDRTATVELLGGASMSVQQLIEGVLVGHARQHLATISAVV